MDFTKPALTWDEQIEQLRARGLDIPNHQQARHSKLQDEISRSDEIFILTYVRNLCAHHSRLWNRRFTITMPIPRSKPAELISSFNPNQSRRVYNTLVMLAALMDIVSPGHLWKGRLQRIIKRHHIQTRAMGFPDDWQQRPIWAEVQESG